VSHECILDCESEKTGYGGQRRYAQTIPRIAPAYPYETLARSGRIEVLEGTPHFDRYFVHKFASMDLALAFYSGDSASGMRWLRACDYGAGRVTQQITAITVSR
jgi:uncharacterized protein (DUF1330 family)